MFEDKEPSICKKLIVKTDTEGEDYIFKDHFKAMRMEDFLLIRTFKDKEYKQIDQKYLINLKFIMSMEYQY